MFYDVYCELCSKNGLTPSGAAAKIGFNRASVTVWKNSGKPPKMELLLKIADYFNVTTDYLLKISETIKKAQEQYLSDVLVLFCCLKLFLNLFSDKVTNPGRDQAEEPLL